MAISDTPPYFDGLLERLESGDSAIGDAFGRHVHWGYWHEPSKATCNPAGYDSAAEQLCRLLCDLAGIEDGMTVVDVGCGFGGTLASLNERFSNLRLIGVNIDPRQLKRARELVKPRADNSVEFLLADASCIPLPNESADVVLAVESIFHFDRRRFFIEAARLLRSTPAAISKQAARGDQALAESDHKPESTDRTDSAVTVGRVGGTLCLSDFVPAERAVEYFDQIDFAADEAVRFSYGNIDLSCSLSRYRKYAAEVGLELSQGRDITPHTLPTYDFLLANAARWENPRETELFTRATRRLQKASQKGMLGYQLLRFERNVG